MRHLRAYAEYVAEATEDALAYAEYVAEQIEKAQMHEAISGTEIPVPVNGKGSYFGPAYGDTESPNTIDSHDTKVIYSQMDGKFYTEDDYNDLYQDYLKKGGKPLQGFSIENIETILSH